MYLKDYKRESSRKSCYDKQEAMFFKNIFLITIMFLNDNEFFE